MNAPTVEELRKALNGDPTSARLIAHLGRRVAADKSTNPTDAARARAQADFLTRHALTLEPNNEEIKKIRAVVVQMPELH